MKLVTTFVDILKSWIGIVAGAVIAGFDRVASPRVIRLREQDDGSFSVEAAGKAGNLPSRATFADGVLSADNLGPALKGSRVEILLKPQRFLFRPLELPSRAADFLEGIVRAQIDRLTPWSAAEAAFGCSAPTPHGGGLTTIIAATTRRAVQGFVDAATTMHPAAVAICADADDQRTAPITVFEQKARGHLDAAKLGRALLAVLMVFALAAALSSMAATYVSMTVGAQEDTVAAQIAQRRAAIRASSEGGDRSPSAALERRKLQTPSSVLVLEALSQVLPDHTYVTEMHLAGNRVQIVGITRDAPSLIPLIEQSPLFTRATFYAPTTRAPSDPGERFHIETRIETHASSTQ